MLNFHALNFMDAHNSKQNKSLDIHCIQWNLRTMDVHGGERPLVHYREVVPSSLGGYDSLLTVCHNKVIYIQSVGGKQCVHSMDVVRFSVCPLSEVSRYCIYIYLIHRYHRPVSYSTYTTSQ